MDIGYKGILGRTRRATGVPVSSYARSLVGKTFNFSNLTAHTKGVTLSFNGKSLDLASFTIHATDMVRILNIVLGFFRNIKKFFCSVKKLCMMSKEIFKTFILLKGYHERFGKIWKKRTLIRISNLQK